MRLQLQRLALVFLLLSLLSGCSKDPDNSEDYTTYIIRKGQQYADGTLIYKQVSGTNMRFGVRFDSSCIYTTVDPVNQGDINKLYGFSDCETLHQENSARVGWRWTGTAMELHAYCYNNGVRSSKLLGTIQIGEVQILSIKVSGNQFVFEYKGVQTQMSRYCNNSKFSGYQLFPYFGGDEVSPHEMKIYIKDLGQ